MRFYEIAGGNRQSVNIMNRTPQILQKAIERFAREHQEYSVQHQAIDKCRDASIEFCDLLRSMGYKGKLWIDDLAVVGGVLHVGVFAFGYWIDWTARQYDPKAQWPAIKKENCRWSYADHLRSDGIDVH